MAVYPKNTLRLDYRPDLCAVAVTPPAGETWLLPKNEPGVDPPLALAHSKTDVFWLTRRCLCVAPLRPAPGDGWLSLDDWPPSDWAAAAVTYARQTLYVSVYAAADGPRRKLHMFKIDERRWSSVVGSLPAPCQWLGWNRRLLAFDLTKGDLYTKKDVGWSCSVRAPRGAISRVRVEEGVLTCLIGEEAWRYELARDWGWYHDASPGDSTFRLFPNKAKLN